MSVSPQPTRGPVMIRFDLPRAGLVSIELFDVTGRKKGMLPPRRYEAGAHLLTTELAALGASDPGSGVNYVRLSFEGRATTRAIVVLR